jgi:hypothetical protein
MFYRKSSALSATTSKLFDICKDISDQGDITCFGDYRKAYFYNAYFDDTNIMYSFTKGMHGDEGEFSFYTAYDNLLRHYFNNKGFSVEFQSKSKEFYKMGKTPDTGYIDKPKGIIRDFCVKIIDPMVYKDRKTMTGIGIEGVQIKKNYYDLMHSLVEIKKPDVNNKQQ